mmetsp:Transcript_3592/g.5099  ORF Transcript_3592/g.5099 Transcript_3592/m.5099 type:complete len:328 (+) Transcript_3592:3-986(+)
MEDELSGALRCYARQHATAIEAAEDRHTYAESHYWEQRFSVDDGAESFDWYVTYAEIQDAMEKFCPPAPGLLTLMVGCGSAPLSSEMYADGYCNLVNMDIVSSVVSSMRTKSLAENPPKSMEWAVMDGTRMAIRSNSFDLAVDKGTLDALLSTPDTTQASALIAEVWRVLKPGGTFILVTHSKARGALLDAALAEHVGPEAAWSLLEARWNRLSNQATLINLMRARLGPGQSIVDAFRDIPLLQEVGQEVRKVIKVLLLMDLFRSRRKLALQKDGADAWKNPSDTQPEEPTRKHWDDDASEGQDAPAVNLRKQPFCFLYILRKRVLA